MMVKSTAKKLVFPVVLLILLSVFLVYRTSLVAIDSDYANLTLEAHDIVTGNPFLTGWNLTGISFITTDLVYFSLGSLLFGVNVKTYFVAAGLMIAVCIWLGYYLSGSRRNWVATAVYFLLCLIPGYFAMTVLRAHTGAVNLFLLALLCVSREQFFTRKKDQILFLCLLALACVGDSVALVVGIVPLILVSILNLLREDYQGRRKWIRLILLCAAAFVLGMLLDKLYFMIGGANKNSFLSDKVFEPFSNWGDKFYVYLRSLLLIRSADFFGARLFSLDTVVFFINCLVILLGFVSVFRHTAKVVSGKETDFVSGVLSVGFLLLSVVFIITNIALDVHSSRYLATFWVLFPVLILRDREWYCRPFLPFRKTMTCVVLALALLSCAFRAREALPSKKALPSQLGLSQFLEENDLDAGYSSFWNASSTTVVSEDRVRVRAVRAAGDGIDFFNWFCQSSWYDEPAHFIITQEGDQFGITEERALQAFGVPRQVLEYNSLKILVYDEDLSRLLLVNQQDHD